MQVRRIRRWAIRLALASLTITSAFVLGRMWTNNFAVVEPGQIYRSGQMGASSLARSVRQHQIKTVLNLRGANPDEPWYQAELQATLDAGATQVDLSMASDMWVSRQQARTILQVLDTCEKPVLIHCQWGAERTGLVTAISELIRPDRTLEEARSQFALFYLYVKAGDGAVMEEHLDRYEAWLRSKPMAHSPEQFRHWLTQVYQPESPSREQWPYDPYPPIIITRPTLDPPAPTTAARQVASEESNATRQ